MTAASTTTTDSTRSRYDSLRALLVKVDDYDRMTLTRQNGTPVRRSVVVPTDEKFDVMHQLNPESIDLMVRLLSTGSIIGQQLAYSSYRNRFSSILDDNNENRHWVMLGVVTGDKISHDDYATMSWNFGNVSEAVGFDAFTYQAYFYSLIENLATFAKQGATDAYWSGVAALAYAGPLDSDSDDTDATRVEYIEWAGNQQNIGSVVKLSRERGTILVPTLDSLLKDQNRVSPSLTEGVL
jgi:hypothetical protein